MTARLAIPTALEMGDRAGLVAMGMRAGVIT